MKLQVELLETRCLCDAGPMAPPPAPPAPPELMMVSPLNLPAQGSVNIIDNNGHAGIVLLGAQLTEEQVALVGQWNAYDAARGGAPYIYLNYPSSYQIIAPTVPLQIAPPPGGQP